MLVKKKIHFLRNPKIRQIEDLYKNVITIYTEELHTIPTPKLEEHSLSGLYNCVFNTFAFTLHLWRSYKSLI